MKKQPNRKPGQVENATLEALERKAHFALDVLRVSVPNGITGPLQDAPKAAILAYLEHGVPKSA